MESPGIPIWLYLAVAIYLIVGFWLIWDSSNRMGNWLGLVITLVYAFIPFIVVIYVILLLTGTLSSHVKTRVSREDEDWFERYSPVLRHRRAEEPPSKKDLLEISRLKIEDQISDAERNDRIEELLSAGKRDDAIALAEDLLKIAREYNDKKNIKRYEKYLLVLRLGPRRISNS